MGTSKDAHGREGDAAATLGAVQGTVSEHRFVASLNSFRGSRHFGSNLNGRCQYRMTNRRCPHLGRRFDWVTSLSFPIRDSSQTGVLNWMKSSNPALPADHPNSGEP